MSSSNTEIKKTLKMLKKLPMFKELKRENKELVERIRSLEYAVNYLEAKNAKLEKKLSKKQTMNPIKLEPTNYGIIDLTEDDDDDHENIVLVIEEADAEEADAKAEEDELKKNTLGELLAKYPDYQSHKEIKKVVQEIVEEVVIEVEEEEEVVVEEEEVVEVEEEEVEEEEVVEVEEEEVVEVEEEEVVEVEEEEVVEVEEEEVVEEEVEEEEVEEEEVVEEEVVEVEEEEVVEVEEEEVVEVEEGEEEDVYEIQINGKTYYVTNEIDSIIYEADEEGEITIEAGAYKNGKPVFN